MRVDRNMALEWDNMRRGIDAQVLWLKAGPPAMLERARAVLGGDVPPKVYLVGCGDSYFCGLAARQAFEEWTGVPTEAVEALEFSRYVGKFAPSGALVVCVSNSGRVARTVESAIRARAWGLRTIALTFDVESHLAKEAESVLTFGYEDVGFGPGTLSYTASLGGLLVLAARVAELGRGRDDGAAEEFVTRVSGLSAVVGRTIAQVEGPAQTLAATLGSEAVLHIIGGGPNYGTALFGMAKMIEAAALPAIGQELEEWAHEQYFCTQPGTTTVVLAPPGEAIDRAREQLRAVRDVGGVGIAVCDEVDRETTALATSVLQAGTCVDEVLSPLVYCIPLELLAYHYAMHEGKVMLGFDDARRMEVNFRQIFGSTIAGVS